MKIAIMGYSGSGKSTLARELGEISGTEVLHFDTVQFLPNWEIRDPEEKKRITEDFMNTHDSWVIDGNYFRISSQRYEQADLVIFLNYNRLTCLNGVVKRYNKYKKSSRPDMASGCKERLNFSFLMWVLFTGRTRKRKKHMFDVIKNAKSSLIFKNRKQLNKYLKEIGVI